MDNETLTDIDLILDAEALIMRGLDDLRIVALRAHSRDRKAEVMRSLRQRARTHDAAPMLPTSEPLDLAG